MFLCLSQKKQQTNQRSALPNQFTSLIPLSVVLHSNRNMASTFQSRLRTRFLLHLLLSLLSSRKNGGMVEPVNSCICGCTMSCATEDKGRRIEAENTKSCLLINPSISVCIDFTAVWAQRRRTHAHARTPTGCHCFLVCLFWMLSLLFPLSSFFLRLPFSTDYLLLSHNTMLSAPRAYLYLTY